MKKHERIQKIKESPEWNWYQERLNLIKDEDTRFHDFNTAKMASSSSLAVPNK